MIPLREKKAHKAGNNHRIRAAQTVGNSDIAVNFEARSVYGTEPLWGDSTIDVEDRIVSVVQFGEVFAYFILLALLGHCRQSISKDTHEKLDSLEAKPVADSAC